MVSVSCFGVRVSVMFHFMFVHYTFSSILFAEWPPLGNSCSLGKQFVFNCILSICNIYLFSVLVLRAGFVFRLHQFLFIAFLFFLAYRSETSFEKHAF